MDESQLRTIEQIERFLAASTDIAFTAHDGDVERYTHISRVLKRFDYTTAANTTVACCCATCNTPAATAASRFRDWWRNGTPTAP